MPVPVPRLSKPIAHPVIKKNNCGDGQINPFQHLTRTLPVSPTGPPPSFGTREQWINSLPSWRRTKPRRIWEDESRFVEQRAEQDFRQGLTVADNASVIKGTHAQAWIPPLHTLPEVPGLSAVETPIELPQGSDGDADDEMSSGYSAIGPSKFDNKSQWSTSSPIGDDADSMDVEHQSQLQVVTALAEGDGATYDEPMYERGAFTPVFEDESPGTASGHDDGSSPLEPVTPFGEFVDRAVAATQPYPVFDNTYAPVGFLAHEPQYDYPDQLCGPQCYQAQPVYQPVVEQPKEQVPAPEVVTPTATPGYKKLAEPLSDWIANYVWKVCTTGLSLPSKFSRPPDTLVKQYANSPPSYLAASVHSLLLSTLLQPSAVFLAIWYIVRLPVIFGAVGLSADHARELRFRVALLGDIRESLDREAMEASAPFRLIVLGCMLANKWLDDHTFSNKTWHTISNVPIHLLNKLESLTLDIFSYDLSVSSRDWSQWLSHIMSYHLSLTSPSYPQPISRPSTNPHAIVRKAIDEIIQAPAACNSNASSQPQPVFLGLEERRREKLEKELALAVDVLEIDLDEDGPLREEYLPKRRVSGAGSIRSCHSAEGPPAPTVPLDKVQDWERRNVLESEKPLPPPAKWSPAGDEPILRERNRISGQYVAVQPPLVNSVAPFQVLPPQYHQTNELGYSNQNWSGVGGHVPVKQQSATGYVFDVPSLQPAHQSTYHPYPFVLPIALSHSRSQSLSYDQDNSQLRNHLRSNSQSRFEYRCSDILRELAPPNEADAHWTAAGHYPPAPFVPHPSLNYQPTWLRT